MPDDDEGTQETTTKSPRVPVPESPEDVMRVWRDKIAELPKLDPAAAERRLVDMLNIRIPSSLLLPDGYIKLFGQLQHLRGEALQILALVNKHHKVRVAAIKSMQAIFFGMSARKSVGEREADAETWLIYVKRSFIDVDVLNDLAKDALDGINRSVADAVQQLKSINQFGVPTGLLDASQAVDMTDLVDEGPDDNSEEE